MDYKKFVSKKYSTKFNLQKVGSLEDFVYELPILALGKRFKEYCNVDICAKRIENNFVFVVTCLKPTHEIDEHILAFDALGCEALGYSSDASVLWRTLLERNFGEEYRDWTNEQLKKLAKKAPDISY